AKKVMEKKYNTFYATAFLGISVTNWTVIASVLMGVAVLTFVFMLISQKRRNKAEEELDDAKEEYARNREEMLYMRMSGNNGNMQGQGYAYAQQPAIGIEDMRGMINEAVSAMLPNVQQYLPQQASVNEELVQKLIEQNAQNEERIKELTEKNNETIKKMSERNDERIERFLQKLSEQKPAEKEAEREVAAANVNDEIIKTILQGQKEIMERLSRQEEIKTQTMVIPTEKSTTERLVEYDRNSEKIEMLMRNQEMLMQRMNDLAINTALSRQTVVQQPAPQIVEKVVEKPIEKVVEKEVRVEVPVEVEKIVEKEVVKEVKVEVPVVKAVPLTVEKPAPKAKTVAPRLTLDEAYAKLSAKQKKFFDTIKEYAMSKDKCKEKKSTYYILLGQSSVNPLVKLTIKKDCTVALFKMEDEFMKDIRRNATNDGTKVKVKETELIVGDAQALATAKEMIDLREDQIERYNEYLKEQRSMKRK
ncbi:MAG: hypothetical protein K2O08_04845, partial [Clostridia bacterium]|nr:hypothetical protein [Clostridia bacterium]